MNNYNLIELFEVFLMVLVGLMTFVIILTIFSYIIALVGKSKIMEKLGEPAWKGFIPIYGDYIIYKYVWNVKMFFIMAGISIVSLIIRNVYSKYFAAQTDNSAYVLLAIALIIQIVIMIIDILYYHRISKSFGYGVGFTIGLFFLNAVFLMIIGFGKKSYLGNMSVKDIDQE